MNSTTRVESSALAMEAAARIYGAMPLPDPELMVATFLSQIKADWIKPSHMVTVQHAMHAALVDRFPKVELFMSTDLEQVGDLLFTAIQCAEDDDNYYPEAV